MTGGSFYKQTFMKGQTFTMGKMKRFTSIVAIFLLLLLFVTPLPDHTQAATTMKINLKNNQTFYMLPGTEHLDYKVTASGNVSGDMTCSSSNLTVANIDNMGNLSINDAGSTNITVAAGSHKITRTIYVLKRSDWTKALAIKNYTKIPVKNNVCSIKIKNEMDFPLKTVLHYHLIADSGSTVQTDLKTTDIYLPASKSMTFKMMIPDGMTMVGIDSADFEYQQYGLKSIAAKKIVIRENISKKDNQAKIITESIINKNKNGAILPYHLYLYDKNNQLLSVEYHSISISGKQRTELNYIYTSKDKHQDSYVAKVTYKFETPIPFF